MTPHDVLLKAADIVRERGLARQHFIEDDGRVCMDGAINLAVGMQPRPLFASVAPSSDFPNVCLTAEHFSQDEWDQANQLVTAAHALVNEELGTTASGNAGRWAWNDEVALDADDVAHLLKRAADRPLPDPLPE